MPAAQIRYMGMNQNLYAPFKDKRVREAICLSFDREALVKGLYGGAGRARSTARSRPASPGTTRT